jgi:hypothetical protein
MKVFRISGNDPPKKIIQKFLLVNDPPELEVFFMPPIIKCLGHYVMAYVSVAVNIPSIIGPTLG